jgi:hypothetical protein
MTNDNYDPSGARIDLDRHEALVLFEMLSRWSGAAPPSTPPADCFESGAERAVLDALLCSLEKQLVAPFSADYENNLDMARSEICARSGYAPKLREE